MEKPWRKRQQKQEKLRLKRGSFEPERVSEPVALRSKVWAWVSQFRHFNLSPLQNCLSDRDISISGNHFALQIFIECLLCLIYWLFFLNLDGNSEWWDYTGYKKKKKREYTYVRRALKCKLGMTVDIIDEIISSIWGDQFSSSI